MIDAVAGRHGGSAGSGHFRSEKLAKLGEGQPQVAGHCGALVGAVALVIGGLGNVWEGGSKLCAAVGLCAPGVAPPILPNLDTDWVDGGHTAGEYCKPQLAAYQQQYPIFNITMTELPNETHKSLLGHVRYKFHCAFAATPK